jgi:uncharacterized protein (TIGR02246 family)
MLTTFQAKGPVARLLFALFFSLAVAGCGTMQGGYGTGASTRSADEAGVAAAASRWTQLFVDDNPDTILALYDDDAVLWGTLSPVILRGKPAVRGYFERAYKALPGHKVSFGEQHVRVFGDIAINSGYYTFSFVRDGQPQTIPARYSFVYRKRGNDWIIVDHHSSAVPGSAR